MAIPLWVARFNRRVTNRVTGPFADRLPGFAIVEHVGRRSGKTYHTPVNVFRVGDEYVFALTYGAETDWVRNVEAAGGCEIVTRGQRVRLSNPQLVTETAWRWAPLPVRLFLPLIGVTQCLRMTCVDG